MEEERLLDCQYGKHYYKEKCKEKSGRLRLQGTRKIGCQATIKVKKFNLYPDFKISGDLKDKTWRERQAIQTSQIQCLREALKKDASSVAVLTKFWISLPSVKAHCGHPVGEEAVYSQRIHPLLVTKITEMVIGGITSTSEVKKSLKFYATNILAPQLGIKLSKLNRGFFPTSIDIRNHIYAAKKSLELSKLDQENVQLKVESYKKMDSGSSFFFRPYVVHKSEQTCEEKVGELNEEVNEDERLIGCYKGNTGGQNDTVNIIGSSNQCKQTLLLVHQEQWQKNLLLKYGNNISLIDATYKTTRYDIALFFVCVKTNVGYSVVAEFVIQDETAEKIEEALKILMQWNPQWKPKFFMSDYSEAELLAIEKCFPSTKVFLCDFHREQAWERWTRDHKHGLTDKEQDDLLHLLRACANAPPQRGEEVTDKLVGYSSALLTLKASSVWKDHQEVRVWLSTYWLSIPQVRFNCCTCEISLLKYSTF